MWKRVESEKLQQNLYNLIIKTAKGRSNSMGIVFFVMAVVTILINNITSILNLFRDGDVFKFLMHFIISSLIIGTIIFLFFMILKPSVPCIDTTDMHYVIGKIYRERRVHKVKRMDDTWYEIIVDGTIYQCPDLITKDYVNIEERPCILLAIGKDYIDTLGKNSSNIYCITLDDHEIENLEY